ncbi:hypothetical protein Sjap_005374 [Stephania japonica]|uniref:Uncharacterized protein n=1 Tax=Stephania japonica TaxID=461633 RepID=A0AAP0K3U6_9MAGN
MCQFGYQTGKIRFHRRVGARYRCLAISSEARSEPSSTGGQVKILSPVISLPLPIHKVQRLATTKRQMASPNSARPASWYSRILVDHFPHVTSGKVVVALVAHS